MNTVVERAFGEPRLRLTVRRGPLAAPVLVRTLSMFAARTALPVDRLDDLAEAVESMATALPGNRIMVDARVVADGAGLELCVCGLARGAARSVLSDVRHGGLARILAVAADSVAVRASSRHGESLVLGFAAGA